MSGETYQSLNDAPPGLYRDSFGTRWRRHANNNGAAIATSFVHSPWAFRSEADLDDLGLRFGPFTYLAQLTVPK